MLAVRCEACGLKALVAASQCPHCGHPLDIRDSFGELLPLTHCTTCDASYPRRDGACRWCGSTPERVNYRPYIWKAVGALAFAAMAIGAWFTRDIDPEATTSASAPRPDSVADADTALTRALAAVAEAFPDRAVAVATPASDTTPADTPSTLTSMPPAADTTQATLVVQGATVEPATIESAPAEAMTEPSAPAIVPRTTAPPRRVAPRRAAPWTSAVVVSWAVVRAGPSSGARLLGSVGPGSRVQIGELRGDWRRVRMQGLAGWVQGGRFTISRRVATSRRASPGP
jgi:hypothetical protein